MTIINIHKIYWISNDILPSLVHNCNANVEVDEIQNNQRHTFFICQNIDQFQSVKEDRQTLLNQTLWKDDRAKNVAHTKHGDDNDDDFVKIDDDGDGGGGGGGDGGGGNGDHAECKKNHVSLKMRPI